MLLGCESLGAPPGMLLAPAWTRWPPDWKPLDCPSRCRVRPCRWATFESWLCFCGSAQGDGTLPSPGCPGSTPGCRQQHRAQVPPCMAWSPGGKSRQWVPPAPTGSPGSDTVALPYLFSPRCSRLHPPLQAPKHCLKPWAPPNCCRPPPFLGASQQLPGPGLQLQAGAAFAALRQCRHRRRCFAAALLAPGWDPAPAGAAD